MGPHYYNTYAYQNPYQVPNQYPYYSNTPAMMPAHQNQRQYPPYNPYQMMNPYQYQNQPVSSTFRYQALVNAYYQQFVNNRNGYQGQPIPYQAAPYYDNSFKVIVQSSDDLAENQVTENSEVEQSSKYIPEEKRISWGKNFANVWDTSDLEEIRTGVELDEISDRAEKEEIKNSMDLENFRKSVILDPIQVPNKRLKEEKKDSIISQKIGSYISFTSVVKGVKEPVNESSSEVKKENRSYKNVLLGDSQNESPSITSEKAIKWIPVRKKNDNKKKSLDNICLNSSAELLKV